MMHLLSSIRVNVVKHVLLCAFLFLLPWQTHFLVSAGTIGDIVHPFADTKIFLTEIFVVLAAIASVWERPIYRRSSRRVLLFAVCVFVAAVLSLAVNGTTVHGLSMLDHLFVAMLFFALVLDEHVRVRPLLLAFGVGLVLPALLGVWQVVVDTSFASTVLGLAERNAQHLGDAVTIAADGTRHLRAYGSFSHPNIFGGYCAVGLLALYGFVRLPLLSKEGLGVVGVIVLLFTALLATWSRSAMLGLLLGIALAWLVSKMRNIALARRVVVPIAILVLAAALTATFFAPRIVAGIRGGSVVEAQSISDRAEQYAEYPKVIGSNWLFGNGMGSYAIAAFNARTCTDWDCQPIHNTLLLILAEIGVVGLVAIILWSTTIDKINFARFPNRDALAAFAMGNVVLVIIFFDHYIWSTWSGLALIAFVMALTVRMGEEKE